MMFDKPSFPFDAEKMMEFFKANDYTKYFGDMKMPSFDADKMMATQQKNMEALVEANKAAAAGYQELFNRQVKIFEETMAEAKTQFAAFDASSMSADGATKQSELMRAAFEKALANMTELAEHARKANMEAYEIVAARVKDSVKELQNLMAK